MGHIINTEGEKIEKAYALDLSSVEMTKAITILEMVLQTKLGLFGDCLWGPKYEFPEQSIVNEKE